MNNEDYYKYKLQKYISECQTNINNIETLKEISITKLNRLLKNKIFYEGERWMSKNDLLEFQEKDIKENEELIEIYNHNIKENELKIKCIVELLD